MIYKVHFNIPPGNYYHGTLYLAEAMQEYEGRLVVITKYMGPKKFKCEAYNWNPQNEWDWVFHSDWLKPYSNKLNINLL